MKYKMFIGHIYVGTSDLFEAEGSFKIGCSENPYGRLKEFNTSFPPNHAFEFRKLWATTAQTKQELERQEEEVHNNFYKWRMIRRILGDSEWFNYSATGFIDLVAEFVESRPWFSHTVSVEDLKFRKKENDTLAFLQKPYSKNLVFIDELSHRNDLLTLHQSPCINAIRSFMADPNQRAGCIVAPCGSGKTRMTVEGIREVQKVVICCPSQEIQRQWAKTLAREPLYLVGSGPSATTNTETIRSWFMQEAYCIITTYRSSNLLSDHIGGVQLMVLDEAHHMAGVVAGDDESGVGITRVLMQKSVELDIKRLSLTFTPRIIHVEDLAEAKYLSMDNTCIFGPIIAELNLRDLIDAGILPDYRLWVLRDKANQGTGVIAKAECLMNAWQAKEVVRGGEEVFILHHLIVFAATLEDARTTANYLRDQVDDSSRVFYLEGGDDVESVLRAFSSAPRAILVNCFVLNEGVDIPVANAVAIIYPKQSRGQITQMVLRAGRWAEGKPLFHILLPILGDEDTSGFEAVLTALASHDAKIQDEIRARSQPLLPEEEGTAHLRFEQEIRPEIVVWDEYEADPEKIRQGFENVRKRVFQTNTRGQIRALCFTRGIDTSVDYRQDLRQENPELPENPCFSGETWYDFLHSADRRRRMDGLEFVQTVLVPNRLLTGSIYDEWRGVQPTDIIAGLPSVQHINDGYFGADDTDFKDLIEKFRPASRRSR